MVEATHGSSFPFKPLPAIGPLGEVLRENLEGDFSIQAAVFSQVHLPHAPLADLLDDAVMG